MGIKRLKIMENLYTPWFFLLILIRINNSLAYIQVPVEQATYIMPYNTSNSDMHCYFDVSYADQEDLI